MITLNNYLTTPRCIPISLVALLLLTKLCIAAPIQDVEGLGRLALTAGTFNTPFDLTAAQKCMSAISIWEKENKFDHYLVEVFSEHELVKNLKNGAVLAVYLTEYPDIIFWIDLKPKGQQILREHIATGNMELLAPPPKEKLDLSFIGTQPN